MKRLSPSILSADFAHLLEDIEKIEEGGADLIHIDVMDGHFVPNISYGSVITKALEGKTKLSFDVHLMIESPDDYLEDFLGSNTEFITVHQEACEHLDRTIEHIRSSGVKAGVSLNPATPVSTLKHVIDKLDMVLIMSVNPGFAGQSFIGYSIDKIKELAAMRSDMGLNFKIQVDGGVSLENAEELMRAGADILVVGSNIFKANDVVDTTRAFIRLLKDMS